MDEMRVAIDQSRRDQTPRKIDYVCIGGVSGCLAGWPHRDDASILDDNFTIFDQPISVRSGHCRQATMPQNTNRTAC